MKHIYLYQDGSAAVIDDLNNDLVSISGQEPSQILDYTHENMLQYFGIDLNKQETTITVL